MIDLDVRTAKGTLDLRSDIREFILLATAKATHGDVFFTLAMGAITCAIHHGYDRAWFDAQMNKTWAIAEEKRD